MSPLLLGNFCTMFRQRSAASLGERQSLSRPRPFGDARAIAFYDIPGTPEFVQLPVLTPAGGNGEHQQCSTVLLDALQHREERWSELQITHKGMASNGRRIRFEYLLQYTKKSIPRTSFVAL